MLVVSNGDGSALAAETVRLGNNDARERFIKRVGRDEAERTELRAELLKLSAGFANQIEADDNAGDDEGNAASRLARLAQSSGAEFFCDPAGETFATFLVREHYETHRLNSRATKRWLSALYFHETGSAPNAEAIGGALLTLEGISAESGVHHDVHIRSALQGDNIILDTGDDEWRAIIVNRNSWRMVSSDACPVKFRRAAGMQSLPVPDKGGDIQELRKFVNIDDAGFVLLCCWMVMALRPTGPYPILMFNGGQGSGKSSASKAARRFIDPSSAPLRRPPKNEHDLQIAASNGWVLSFDNLSGITTSMSDALCTLATGGGLSTRRLFTDCDEQLFHASRPIICNGIDQIGTRADLLDRSIVLRLPDMADEDRVDESELWAGFDDAAPRIFGGLLNALSVAIRNIGSVKLKRRPRMLDFGKWGTAAETSMGFEAGTFLDAYMENRENSAKGAVEDSPVAAAIVSMVEECGHFRGTASDLLNLLSDPRYATEKSLRHKSWPQSARGLRNVVDRTAPALRHCGISVIVGDRSGTKGARIIEIHADCNERSVRSEHSEIPPEGSANDDCALSISTERADNADTRCSADNGDTEPESTIAERTERTECDRPTLSPDNDLGPAPGETHLQWAERQRRLRSEGDGDERRATA